MKIKLCFCLYLVLLAGSVQAQHFTWATQVSGSDFELGTKSIKDAAGNTYFIGYSLGSAIVYNGVTYPTSGGGDAFFAKLDVNKALVWMKTIGGDDPVYYDTPQDIHIDPFGDIYLTFKSCGNNFKYNGQVLSGINSPGEYGGEAVLLKVNANGNYLWHDSGTIASCFEAVTTDQNGNVYLTGYFDSTITLGGAITLTNPSTGTTRDMLVAKYQPNGTILWAKHAGGMPHNTFADGRDISINPQTNEVIVLGHGEGAVFFDGVPMPLYNGIDEGIVLLSYTMSGTQNWVKRVLDVTYDGLSEGLSLDISNTGMMGVSGATYFTGLVGFYNSDGTVISEQAYPSSNQFKIYSLAFNEFNEAYIAGWCYVGGTLGIAPGTATLTSETGFIAKIDSNQQVQWLEECEDSGFSNKISYKNGVLSYAGRIDNNFSYNSGQNVIVPIAADALFGEIIDQQRPLSVASSLPENSIIYPNPTSGLLRIEADGLQQVEVYSVSGTLLQQANKNQVDLSPYARGIYFVKISTDKGSAYKKVVLQ